MEYKILSAVLTSELNTLVTTYLKLGWTPVGGVNFDYNSKQVMQAMMKNDRIA